MTDTTDTTEVFEELRAHIERLRRADRKERGEMFASLNEVAFVERLAVAGEQDKSQLEALLAQLSCVPGVSGKAKQLATSVRGAARRMERAQADARAAELVRRIESAKFVSETIPDHLAEVLETELLVPQGYEVGLDGIHKLFVSDDDIKRTKICHSPFVILRKSVDIATSHIHFHVAWVESAGPSGGRPQWKGTSIDRGRAFEARKLTELSLAGAPISSVNARDMVEWLVDFENANQHRLPTVRETSQMGWQDDNSFVLPDIHVRGEDQTELSLTPPEGMEEYAQAFGTRGTWEGWLQAVEAAREHPLMMLSIYASISSVLLHVTGGNNYIVDWSNDTSTGKTTALRLGASAWGDPQPHRGIICKWDRTRVWIERTSAFNNSLPLILDDTKHAKSKDDIGRVIYDFCGGQGRGRGTLTGVQKQSTWRGVMLSTGEQRLTSFTEDGGTRARVLSFEGPPVLKEGAEGRLVVEEISRRVTQNYGHLGRKVVDYLVHHHSSWDEIRSLYENRRHHFASICSDAVGGRLSDYAAALDLARGVCEALGVPVPTNDPLEYLVRAIRSGSDDSDRPLEAMYQLLDWAGANTRRFYLSKVAKSVGLQSPAQGWVGRWEDDKAWDHIYVTRDWAAAMLSRWDHSPVEIFRRWKMRGWTTCGQKRSTKNARIEGHAVRCIAIRRSLIEELTQRLEVPKATFEELPTADYYEGEAEAPLWAAIDDYEDEPMPAS